jgi:hypothetical protein
MTTPQSPAAPSAQTMRRLAFVRMFFQHGVDQARQPEPLNVTALLNMHDTAELFMQVAADHLGAVLGPVVYFMDYFKQLNPAKHPGGVKLLRQREMTGLNNLRNEFKHRGTLPGPQAVHDACAHVRAFLEENTPLVFGIALTDIGMAEVIPQEPIRDKVRAASVAAASGDLINAMGELAEAYDELFEAGSSRRRIGRFGDTIRPMAEHDITQAVRPCPNDKTRRSASADYRNLAKMISDIADAGADIQRAMRVMALGIDYRQFERFQDLTPRIFYFVGGGRDRRTRPDYAPTAAEFDFCCDFMVTAALRVAEQPA